MDFIIKTEQLKPLGYEAQKAILQGLNINIRRNLCLKCPEIRVAHKSAPFQFEDVILHGGYSGFDSFTWPIAKNGCDGCKILLQIYRNLIFEKRIKRIEQEVDKILLMKYLKPGTFIKQLVIVRKSPVILENSSIFVEQLTYCYNGDPQILQNIFSIIHKSCKLKILKVDIDSNSISSLNHELVQNAEHLKIEQIGPLPDDFPDILVNITNKVVTLNTNYRSFPVEKAFEMGMKWISMKREIGTKFYFQTEEYTYLRDAIKCFKSKCSESFITKILPICSNNCLAVPINEDLVLVIFEEGKKKWNWSFRMEVMKMEDVISRKVIAGLILNII